MVVGVDYFYRFAHSFFFLTLLFQTQQERADQLMNPVNKPSRHNLDAAPAHNPGTIII